MVLIRGLSLGGKGALVILAGFRRMAAKRGAREEVMNRVTFSTALLFAPVAYAIHHYEEHILFNFREWRLLYFPNTNELSTELVFMILTSVSLIYVILHNIFPSRASARSALLFLMASQVHNVIFHAGSTLYFWHFSPGLYTAIALYVPVNILIAYVALKESWVSGRSLVVLFVAGGAVFWMFEVVGPAVIAATVLGTYVWIAVEAIRQTASQSKFVGELAGD